MAEQLISLNEFWNLRKQIPLIDARSEREFEQSQIPSSFNLPILTNEERIKVGTLYKEKGSIKATLKGFELVGPRFHQIQKEALERFPDRKAIVYCWRGGMRSAAVAWLLDLYGFKIEQLSGGYKAYRNWVLAQFEKNYSMKVLGGYTGSGKTEILLQLQKSKIPVIDLEGLANHKGSAFGALGQHEQASQEQFENKLAGALFHASNAHPYFWIEDESQRIGTNMLPVNFFKNIRNSICYFIDIPFEARLQFIVEAYGKFPVAELIAATLRIQKRLGGLETKTAVNCLVENNIEAAFTILLKYYDKVYLKNIETAAIPKLKIEKLEAPGVNPIQNAGLFMHL